MTRTTTALIRFVKFSRSWKPPFRATAVFDVTIRKSSGAVETSRQVVESGDNLEVNVSQTIEFVD